MIFVGLASAAGISNNLILGDKELRADQSNFLLLENTFSNMSGVLFPHHSLAFELKTTNGIIIPKTDVGNIMSEAPNSLTNNRTDQPLSVWPGEFKALDFPALTDLFNFPSNGVYLFELRCWTWSKSNRQYVLCDPIRLRVIKGVTNGLPRTNVQGESHPPTNTPDMP